MEYGERETFTRREFQTALANLEWLVRHREASYYPDSETVVDGDGGAHEDALIEEGMTPATDPRGRA
jgi:hypothetical protein